MIEIPTRILDLARAGMITSTELYVYLFYIQMTGGYGNGCVESKPKMAEKLKIGHNQLRQAIRRLAKLSVIQEIQKINEPPTIYVNPPDRWSEETKSVPLWQN